MKYFLIFQFICVQYNGYCQARTDSSEFLLNKLRDNTITKAETTQLKAFAFDFQNRGQILDESKHDYAASLTLVSKAIVLFNALTDTLNEANNRKFKGYLLGRFDKFIEGKTQIAQAILLFKLKKADWGVAVSEFNLARLFELENKPDSALFYCNKAISYWKAKGDTARMFLNQNLLIHVLTKMNKLTEAILLQNISEKMAKDPDLHWQGLLDFYLVSEKLFKAAKEFRTAEFYQGLYAKKISALNEEGIVAVSYYAGAK